MGRLQKQGLDFFPHATDASSDEKLLGIESLHGDSGYTFYFKTLERIYAGDTDYLDLSKDWQVSVHGKYLGKTPEQLQKMIKSAIDVGLFDKAIYESTKHLTSNGIITRRQFVIDERAIQRQRQSERRAKSKLSHEQTDDKQGTKVEQSSDNHKESIQQLYELWNGKSIVVHKTLTDKMARKVRSALKDYSIEDISNAMENYSKVISHPDIYYFTYKWTLEEFISRGIEKFLDGASPLTNFLKDKNNGKYLQSKPTALSSQSDLEESYNRE
jgi:hypothetical protein